MKTILKITAIALLACLGMACEDNLTGPFNNPDRLSSPGVAVITHTETNECPAQTITMTVTASGADSYLWFRNGVLLTEETGNTLTVESGEYFPSEDEYYAVGVNPSGLGLSGGTIRLTFTPCQMPEKPVITGESINVCPFPFGRVQARAKYATTYRWYFNGQPLDHMPTSIVWFPDETGEYRARGINLWGEGPLSDPFEFELDLCIPFEITGIWEVTGTPIGGAPSSWRDTITEVPGSNGTQFAARNYVNAGLPLIFHRNTSGQFYLTAGEQVIVDGSSQSYLLAFAWENHATVTGQTAGNFFMETSSGREMRMWIASWRHADRGLSTVNQIYYNGQYTATGITGIMFTKVGPLP